MEKPKTNKMFVQELEDSLKISFPMAGFNKHGMAVLPLLIVIIGVVMAIAVASAIFFSKSLLAIVMFPFLFGLLGFITIGFVPFVDTFFSKSYIIIDAEKIIFSKYLIFRANSEEKKSIPKEDLKAIKYIKRAVPKNIYFHAINDRKLIFDLMIETEAKEYSFNKETLSDLGETEMNWLVKKISNRLNFPINIVHEEFEWVSNQEESFD